MDPKTFEKRLVQASVTPGEDKCFSSSQVFAVVFGDIDGEKLRLTREQADKLALENETSRGKLIHTDELVQRLGKFLSAAKARIYSNQKLEVEEKDKILGILAACLKSVEDSETIITGDSDSAAEVLGQ